MPKQGLAQKLEQLPKEPGVYFHKNPAGEIIYVGKASNLRNRIRSYFQKSRNLDFKTRVMIEEIADTDWLEVGSEVEALFLESAMIKRYQPKYNVLLRDDKNFLYVKISNDEFPRISYTRRPMDDQADYFGPFTSSLAVKKAMKQLRKVFPYVTHRMLPKRACLQHHLGLCPGPEVGAITQSTYRKNLRYLRRYLSGKGGAVMKELRKQMQVAAKGQDYERAATLRDQVQNLEALERQHLFSQQELFDVSRDQALTGLQELLGLSSVPRRIECYDISHLQGTNNVASMVVFSDGVPNRGEYRKFKMRLRGNDDFAHMREVITRRLRHWDSWPRPDLLVIDGGKGQVSVVWEVLGEHGIATPAVGLAKRFEEVIRPSSDHGGFEAIRLDKGSHVLKLLQHIRDEAHRFAVTYHSTLRGKTQTASLLEEIPGVGSATRKKLIKRFGSYRGVKAASQGEIADTIGPKLAQTVAEHLR